MMIKHKHHIIPRHAGGTDELENLIELTIPEHAMAHRKLYEEYGRWEDRIAWQTLSGQISQAEAIKQTQIEANLGNKHFLGKKHSKETKAKMSASKKIHMIGNSNALGHRHSEETKEVIREKRKHQMPPALGHKHTEETRKKMSIAKSGKNNPHYGKPLSEEHKAKISASKMGNTNGKYKAKKWLITAPGGETYVIKNLAQFSRDNNLQRANMVNGHTSKGYTASKIF